MKIYFDSPDVMPCPVPTLPNLLEALDAYREAERTLNTIADDDFDAMYGPAWDVALLRERLIFMVLVANGLDPAERLACPVSVHLGDTLLSVAEHPQHDWFAQEFDGPRLLIVPVATVGIPE